MDVMIRPLQSAADGVLVEEISMAAWREGEREAVPSHVSVALMKENGGVILLAFVGEVAVGFCWGFWAWDEFWQKWKCASHLLGVRPEYQGMKIGERLKWAQRAYVLEKGIDLMTWTFDPLETKNGMLNIRKLGAANHLYLRNLYGEMETLLERGIPTDRFVATWHLGTKRVEMLRRDAREVQSVADFGTPAGRGDLNGVTFVDGVARPVEVDVTAVLEARPGVLLVYVPWNYQEIKQSDLELALQWRLHTRAVFEAAFAEEYLVVNLLGGDGVCVYMLVDSR